MFLNNENNKYYNIHTRNPKILNDIVHKNIVREKQNDDSTKKESGEIVQKKGLLNSDNIQTIEEREHGNLNNAVVDYTCNYIEKFHHYCYESIFLLNVELDVEFDKVQTIMNTVEKYYEFIINSLYTLGKQYSNHNLKKITLNLITVLEFSNEWIWDKKAYKINLTKFFHYIINELNEYGIKFCRPLKYDYIVFQNTELNLTELDNDELTGFDDTNDIYKHVQDFKKMTTNFRRDVNSIIYNEYKIKLLWKGEYKTTENIFFDILYSLSYPTFVFALYDIIFKFSIAAICCYTIDLYHNEKVKDVNQMYLEISDFPEIYKEFIDEYNAKLTNYIHTDSSIYSSTPNLEYVLTEINARLQVLGIIVDFQFGYYYTFTKTNNLEKIQIIKNLLYNVNPIWKNLKDLYNYV